MSATALLAACQGFPQQFSSSDPAPNPAAPTWRVVERLGDARYLAPSMAGWERVVANGMLPAGSQIATGIGGRLIVNQASNQLSAGTSSRFILPGWEPGGSVHQTAGWLRYRIAGAPSATFGIETPFLALLVDDAVVDVTVGESETEVEVVSGRVRMKTLDGERQIDLHAGYTGYASLRGQPLVVRRGPGRALEAVPATVLPALHPERGRSGAVGSDPASAAPPVASPTSMAPAVVQRPAIAASSEALEPQGAAVVPADHALAASIPAPLRALAQDPVAALAVPARVPAATRRADPTLEARPAPETNPIQTGSAPPHSALQPPDAADRDRAEIRRRFDELTEGLLDGLLPAMPDRQLDGR